MSVARFQLGPSPTNCTNVKLVTMNPTKLLLSNPTHPSWLNQDLTDLLPGSSCEKKSNLELTCFDSIDLTNQPATRLKTCRFFLIFELFCSSKTRALRQVSSRIMLNNYDQNHVNLFPRWDVNLLYWIVHKSYIFLISGGYCQCNQ